MGGKIEEIAASEEDETDENVPSSN